MHDNAKELFRHVIDDMMPAHKLLGITLKDISDGYALLSMPYKPELVGDPRTSRLHGGMIAALLDSCGGAAALTTLTSQSDLLASIDIRIDYLEPGRPQDVLAEAKLHRSGKAIIVTSMRAWHPESDITIAEARGVYRVRRGNETE